MPEVRAMSTLSLIPDFGVFLFGGLSRERSALFAKLDTTTMIWTKVERKASTASKHVYWPEPRSGHTATVLHNPTRLFLYGGDANCDRDGKEEDSSVRPFIENDLMAVFDFAAQTWYPVHASHNPACRYRHTCTRLSRREGFVLLFGGCTLQISPVKRGSSSKRRAAVDDKPLTKAEWVFKNDCWLLNTETMAWEHAATCGQAPEPRCGHTAIELPKGTVIVLGGTAAKKLDAFVIYELCTTMEPMRWTRVRTHGDVVAPARSFHTACLSPWDDATMYVFGGTISSTSSLMCLDTSNYEWTVPETTGMAPPDARIGHAAIMQARRPRKLKPWERPDPRSPAPFAKMWILGGEAAKDGYSHFDVYSLELMPAPFHLEQRGMMYARLQERWAHVKHRMMQKPFRAWCMFMDERRRENRLKDVEDILQGRVPRRAYTARGRMRMRPLHLTRRGVKDYEDFKTSDRQLNGSTPNQVAYLSSAMIEKEKAIIRKSRLREARVEAQMRRRREELLRERRMSMSKGAFSSTRVQRPQTAGVLTGFLSDAASSSL
eukprot:g822.t1